MSRGCMMKREIGEKILEYQTAKSKTTTTRTKKKKKKNF